MKKFPVTSFDAADAGTFGDVLSQRGAVKKLKVGMLGLGYFEYWRMYPALEDIVAADLESVHVRLAAALPECEVVYPGMIATLDQAGEAGVALKASGIEIVVIVAGTYLPDFITMHALNQLPLRPPVILFSSQTGCDVNPQDDYVATMRNSALIAITQLSGSFRKMKLDYETVVGEIADPAAYAEIATVINAHRAVKALKNSTYGLIGHVFRGMYDLEFDRARIKGFLGPEVMTIQAEHLIELWRAVPEAEVEAEAMKLLKRFEVKKIDLEDVKRSVRLGLAMRALYSKFNLDALCFLGQHYIEKITGAPARMGASLLMESDRFMVGCEGDIGGLVMMDLMHRFTGNLPFQAEWGQFDLANNALFLLGHGIAAPELAAGGEAGIRLTCSPEEWGFKGSGLNYEMILKPGPVTLGHFLNTGDSYRMIISRGESIAYPALPCDEIHAMVRVVTPVRKYLKNLIAAGSAHHVIAVHGDVLGVLCKVAELMRVESVVLE
ncbi:MAG: hypothetical protein PHI35_04295 [Victivallaceae bacterium]|nr:hypothetical protein [Victivallaceae bacterium]